MPKHLRDLWSKLALSPETMEILALTIAWLVLIAVVAAVVWLSFNVWEDRDQEHQPRRSQLDSYSLL